MKLQEWLDSQKNIGQRIFKAEFARRCGVSVITVDNWLNGSIPSRENMAVVETQTGGAVTAGDFYS